MTMLSLVFALAAGTFQVTSVVVAPAETLRVEVHGQGPAVVLVPGLFGSAYGFRGVVPLLVERGRTAIVIEPLAMGGSSRPRSADYSLTAQADRIAAVLDTLRIRDAVLVAHSVGAGIALRVALRRPELVHSIVSLDGGPAEAAATPGFRRAMSMAPFIRLFGGAGMIRRKIRSSLVRSSGDASWVTDEVIAEYTGTATADIGATLRAFMAMAESRERLALGPHLGELRCPVLLLVGDTQHDGRVTDREVALLQSGVASFVLELVPGAGHYLHEERPALVADAVERSLVGRVALAPR